jgi:hypothetical protein
MADAPLAPHPTRRSAATGGDWEDQADEWFPGV